MAAAPRGQASPHQAGSASSSTDALNRAEELASSPMATELDLESAIEPRPGAADDRQSTATDEGAKAGAAQGRADVPDNETVEERAAELASRQASFRTRTETKEATTTQEHHDEPEASSSSSTRLRSPPSSPNFRRRRRTDSEQAEAKPESTQDATVDDDDGSSPAAEEDTSDVEQTSQHPSQGRGRSDSATRTRLSEDQNPENLDNDSGENIDGAEGVRDETDANDAAPDAVPYEKDADITADGAEQAGQHDSTSKDLDDGRASQDGEMTTNMATLRRGPSSGSAHQHLAHKESKDNGIYSADDSDEDDEDDEEDDEPALKYSRLRGSVPDILKKDSASALAVSDRFLALGTHSGAIYILDEQGNLTKGFRTHSASVLALAIDSTSDFVASAGMDGLVFVSSLSSTESYTFDFKRVMRTVSLEPGFGRRSTRSFVCGGMAGQLVLREKTWFGHREHILHEGEGPIWTTQWRGNLLAWANDRGVRVFDMANRRRIAFIAPPEDMPRADLFRCTLLWQDDATLIIAWGDCIKVAKVKQQDNGKVGQALMQSPGKPSIEVTAILQLDCMISGIALRGPDLLVLAYITEDDYDDGDERDAQRRREGHRPELRLISQDGDELSSDVLSLQSFARFQCNDYLLVPSIEALTSAAKVLSSPAASGKAGYSRQQSLEDYFYVVSPKDVVIARSRDEKDHIDWLLEHEKYEAALSSLRAMGPAKAKALGFDANVIGETYLGYLIHTRNDWAKASAAAPGILKDNAAAWENFILAAADKSALKSIISAIPTDSPRLSTVTYDLILASFLRFDPSALLETMRKWPPDIYSTQAVILALEDRLDGTQQQDLKQTDSKLPASAPVVANVTDRAIMECLAEVFLLNRQPGRALPYYMRLRKPGVFALIRDHNLFTVVQDQALLLVEFEEDLLRKEADLIISGDGQKTNQPLQSIQLLVDHIHSIPIHRVVSQLQAKPYFLFLYLDALFVRDPQLITDFSDMQVALYAEFESSKLLAYLRTMSSYYSFEKAYQVCKARDLVPEMVFLLSRIGDSKTALMLIIERLDDVERAISFVKEEKDPELWEDLVQYSEDKPRFIRGLLENVGGEVDAAKLIRRIKDGLEIEGLKNALIKILGDFALQTSLLEGCAGILESDGRTLSLALHQRQSQGMYCGVDTVCSSCGQALDHASPNVEKLRSEQKDDSAAAVADVPTDFVMFLCGHAHHLLCLISNPASVPKKIPARGKNASADPEMDDAGDAISLNMTTTRALATGQLHAAAIYGPQQRATLQRQHLQSKLRYAARLRVILKRGCPQCHAERERSRA